MGKTAAVRNPGPLHTLGEKSGESGYEDKLSVLQSVYHSVIIGHNLQKVNDFVQDHTPYACTHVVIVDLVNEVV